MHFHISFLLTSLLLLVSTSQAKKKPSDFFTLCKRSDPELSKCFLSSALAAKDLLLNGIPELKMQPIEPLFIPKISMEQGDRNFKFSFEMNNLTVFGQKDSNFTSFSVDKDFNWMNYTSFTKAVHMEGEYMMDGKVLVLPVKGTGKALMDFYDVDISAQAAFEKFQKKGQTYLRCKKFYIMIVPTLAKSYFTNLFNGDERLGETTNKFFNDNWKETYETYKELPQEAFGEYIRNYINSVFSQYPEKEWILD